MIKKATIYGTILFLSLTLFAIAQALTTTGCDLEKCRIDNGDSLEITTTCTPCRKVTNNSGGHIFVPISTCNEWNAFLAERTDRDGVSVSECSQPHATPTVTFDTPTYGINQPLSWTRISTASGGYRVEIQRDGGSWTLYNSNVSQPASGTTVTLTIPSSEFNSMGTRRFRVRANASGSYLVGGWGYSPTRTIQKANQSAPSAPTCSSSTQNSVTISSCSGCEYRRGTLSAQSSNIFTGLTAGTSYTFSRRLAETTTHNASSWSSNVTCATTASTHTLTVLSYPLNVVHVSITSSPSAYGGTTNYQKFDIPNGTSITLTAPQSSGSYSFSQWTGTGCTSTNRTVTVSMTTSRDCSAHYEVSSQPAAPATPTGVSCSAVSTSQINVSWNSVSGATGYYVYRCAGSGCTPTSHVLTTSSNSWANTGLASGTTYGYRIRAYNSSGTSGYSSVASCTTQTANNTISVNSSPISGISISDYHGQGMHGTTNYTRTSSSPINSWLGPPTTHGSYQFSYWSGCYSVSGNYCQVYILNGGSMNVTAHYVAASTRTLTVNSSGAASVPVTGSPTTYGGTTNYSRSSIADGTSLTLTAPQSSGGRNFSSWSGTGCSSASRTITVSMTTNRNCTANYVSSGPQPCTDGGGVVGGVLRDSRDNQQYQTVQIGSQCWTAKNANFSAGGSMCYNNNSANCTNYGRLYIWNTAQHFACPSGWSIGTVDQWITLNNSQGASAGLKLRSARTGMPTSGNSSCPGAIHTNIHPYWWYYGWPDPICGSNTSGFGALPGGSYSPYGGTFGGLGNGAAFWTSTPWYAEPSGSYYAVDLHIMESILRVGGHASESHYGKSVRCIRN
jgi:uncharacterized protein (TIGR02145 family)